MKKYFLRYNEQSDDYLNKLYESIDAETWKQRIVYLETIVNPYEFVNNEIDEQKVAYYEYGLLHDKGLLN